MVTRAAVEATESRKPYSRISQGSTTRHTVTATARARPAAARWPEAIAISTAIAITAALMTLGSGVTSRTKPSNAVAPAAILPARLAPHAAAAARAIATTIAQFAPETAVRWLRPLSTMASDSESGTPLSSPIARPGSRRPPSPGSWAARSAMARRSSAAAPSGPPGPSTSEHSDTLTRAASPGDARAGTSRPSPLMRCPQATAPTPGQSITACTTTRALRGTPSPDRRGTRSARRRVRRAPSAPAHPPDVAVSSESASSRGARDAGSRTTPATSTPALPQLWSSDPPRSESWMVPETTTARARSTTTVAPASGPGAEGGPDGPAPGPTGDAAARGARGLCRRRRVQRTSRASRQREATASRTAPTGTTNSGRPTTTSAAVTTPATAAM
ncbi:hypothetical protein D9V30_04240 [Mycetocola reblochoni]|uniref:Uncharacterized protein n=1 Tax=Mycetocola reblochoni TaxID=331618 RepID=A0A3L6ZS25_9MICO|nr:hypothetical protein [Mycetocola reblochoni]RLP69902.1 hypothetical protein D9V30_04240 [Mycetocola reblochoni]